VRRVAFWFPHNPYPAVAGAHRRCVSILESLRELDCSVTFLSSTFAVDPWTDASVVELKQSLVSDVVIYRVPTFEMQVHRLAVRWARLRSRAGRPSLDSWAAVTPGLRSWTRQQIDVIEPDVVFSSYAQFDPIVPHSARPTVIDAVDFVSVSQAMFNRLVPVFATKTPLSTRDVPPEVLSEGYLLDAQRVTRRELELYDRYSHTLAISRLDAATIEEQTSFTKVSYVPLTAPVVDVDNTYEGAPVFVGGANPFNLQGLMWFARHVLPTVRARVPDFELEVLGRTFAPWAADEGIALRGYVRDLVPVYCSAAFAICPLLSGTGQQVKIVDAMAHGVPVVATALPARSSPIVDGENGFVASTAEELADRVELLWRDRTLCRSLGAAARHTIATELSPSRTTAELEAILG